MRFDTPIYFQLVQRGAYNENTGDYGEDTIAEYKRYAAVNSTGINTLKLMYGEIKEGCLTVRLQRPYKEIFDRIRIGDKLYKVDTQQPLKNKTVFIVSEVQGSYTGTAGDGSIEYQKGYNDGLEQGYKDGFIDGEKSIENYLPYSTMAQFQNLNLFGKADVVINMPLLSDAQVMFRPNYTLFGDVALNRTVEHITVNGGESQPTNINMMFYFADRWDSNNPLKHITLNFDTSKVQYANNVFGSLPQLKTVDGKPFDFSSVSPSSIVRLFYGSQNVEYARFVPNTIKCNFNASDSSAFTTETVDSIIDGLADLTGSTAKKVSWHSTVINKLTIEQLDQIAAKNWLLG